MKKEPVLPVLPPAPLRFGDRHTIATSPQIAQPDDFAKIAFQDFRTEKWQRRGAGYQKSAKSQPPIPE